MTLRDLVRTDVVRASPDSSLEEIAETMREEKVGSVVITGGGGPVGIVTDRDLAVRVLGEGMDPFGLSADDVMTTDLATVDMDDGVYDVVRAMCSAEVRRMPVFEDGELAGIITLDDLVVLLASELQDLSGVIRSESPPY